ncbi:MAG: DEAD/DEAH box helicase, partial [Actinobacteria bacterium]|nr:DEAD/DEAH box helicase [Actinomycetota bacterium]
MGGLRTPARGTAPGRRQRPRSRQWRLNALTTETLIDEADKTPGSPGNPLPPTFAELGTSEAIGSALRAAGIERAFPIQALALPIALGGHDIIGQARTGTGKTLAFGVPVLQRLDLSKRGHGNAPQALIVLPTRELAIQVTEDLKTAGAQLEGGGSRGARVLTVYGGRAYEPQIEALRSGVDVVVGTPGRLLDLARQRHLDLSAIRTLVLDEADKMLDLGFLPDVERILQLTPEIRQTMLFSATMPGEVVMLARRYLRQPTHVRAEQHDEPALVPSTEQHVYRTHHLDKIEILARLLQAEDRGLTMVFCQTKRAADQVATTLSRRGFAAAAVHGDLGQGQRERALRAFRNGKVDVLVATEVAARGLDVASVTHVVNYECPEDDKAYLHRIGRTGRAGSTGIAVTFVDWQDLQRWKLINAALGLDHADPPETYSTSESLYQELRIPASATSELPSEQRARAGLEAEEVEDIGETGRTRSPRERDREPVRKRLRRRTRSGKPVGSGTGGTGGGADGGKVTARAGGQGAPGGARK